MSAEGDVDLVVRAEFFPCKTNGVLLEVCAAKPNYLDRVPRRGVRAWLVITLSGGAGRFVSLPRRTG